MQNIETSSLLPGTFLEREKNKEPPPPLEKSHLLSWTENQQRKQNKGKKKNKTLCVSESLTGSINAIPSLVFLPFHFHHFLPFLQFPHLLNLLNLHRQSRRHCHRRSRHGNLFLLLLL